MTGEAEDRSKRWALPASAVVHALVAALLIFGLPVSLPQVPEEEQAISVTLEPPAEAPPEPPPAPEAQPEAPPAPEPTPEPEAPQEAEAPAASQEQPAAPVPVLRPVVAYGETDAGPRESLDGSGIEDSAQPVAQDEPTSDEAETPVEEATTDEAATESPTEDEAPPVEPAENPEPAGSATAEEPETTDDAAADEPVVTIVGPVPIPSPRPARPEPPQTVASVSEPALRSVPTLFSRSATGGPTATTAMAGLPRGVRAGRLCASELRLQLQYGAVPYLPDLLPSYQLASGTVLTVRRGAFRTRAGWRNLSFECQVDPDATRVVSFAFRVGEPISPQEAQGRNLPTR